MVISPCINTIQTRTVCLTCYPGHQELLSDSMWLAVDRDTSHDLTGCRLCPLWLERNSGEGCRMPRNEIGCCTASQVPSLHARRAQITIRQRVSEKVC